jgi:hypothetical protein
MLCTKISGMAYDILRVVEITIAESVQSVDHAIISSEVSEVNLDQCSVNQMSS